MPQPESSVSAPAASPPAPSEPAPPGRGPFRRVRANWAQLRDDVQTAWRMVCRLGGYLKPYRSRWICGLVVAAAYGAWVGALIPGLRITFHFLETGQFELVSLSETDSASTPAPAVPPVELYGPPAPGSASSPAAAPPSAMGDRSPVAFSTVVWVSLVIPLYFLIRGILGYVSAYCTAWVGLRILFDLKVSLFAHLQRLSLDYFASQKSGRLIYSIVQRTKNTQMLFIQLIGDVVKQPMTILGVLAVLFWQDPLFTSAALLFVPISLVPALVLGYLVRNRGKREELAGADSVTILQENLLGQRTIKSFARAADETSRFRDSAYKEYALMLRNRKLVELTAPLVEQVASFGFAAAVVYGIYTQTSASDLILLMGGLFLLYNPFKVLSRMYVTVLRVTAMLEGLFEILDTPPTVVDKPDAHVLTRVEGQFELRNVSLVYYATPLAELEDATESERRKIEHREAVHALKNVSLTFEPGKFYALVGPSGAGKSSIFNLLMRFYDPSEGSILLDGQDLRDLAAESLRHQIALVPQDTFLFHDSIRNNILYGRPGASDAEVEEAARHAFAHPFIVQNRLGYDAVVGDKGCRLSGGQAQRISLARAFLKNAPILLLDEATSALDARSSEKISEALNALARGRTVIAIAHRLSTVQRADQIIVMRRGEVVATGTHEELLVTSKLYGKLSRLQFGESAPAPVG